MRRAAGLVTVLVAVLSLLLAGTALPEAARAGKVEAAAGDAVRRSAAKEADEFFATNAEGEVHPLVRRSLSAFLAAKSHYVAGKYSDAQAVLDELWKEYPVGSPKWLDATTPKGFNIGGPGCYPALVMLDECVRWRLRAAGQPPVRSRELSLVVALVGHSRGMAPRNLKELEAGEGVMVTHDLDPKLLANNYAVIHRSLWLFLEYVQAITDGKLKPNVRIMSFPDQTIPVFIKSAPFKQAWPEGGPFAAMTTSLLQRMKPAPDWLWTLYPTHLPDPAGEFKSMEFVSGGGGPRINGMPHYFADDRWLLTRERDLGQGASTDLEVLTYFPMWFQHEFFHTLYQEYPSLDLEKEAHVWHDRNKWPADFKGLTETDYFQESLHRRIQTVGKPPLHVKLRYTPPPPELYLRLRLKMLVGSYRHEPVENPWHEGTVRMGAPGPNGSPTLIWENAAHVSWRLYPRLRDGVLDTGPDCPYYNAEGGIGRSFFLELKRDEEGEWLPEVTGFRFTNTYCRKLP